MRVPVRKTTPGFETAVQPYLSQLKMHCRSLTRTSWDGDDLMQETLLKAYESWRRKQQPLSQAYLRKIALNAWIDVRRKRKPAEDLKQDIHEYGEMERAQETDKIEAMLKKLTPKQRVALLLMSGLGYTADEAARLVGTSEGAVKLALHRARKRLKTDIYAPTEMDDDTAGQYVKALRRGDTEEILRIYHEESALGAPMACLAA